MIRPWVIRPDQMVYTERYGEVGCVSGQALETAFLQAAAVMERMGGHLSISQVRHPTDFPGEMVTTSLAFRWQDRTDAKEQPEQATPAPSVAVDMPAQQFETVAPEALSGEFDVAAPEQQPAARDSIDDGLDPSTLEEEDFDSVPESAR